jgi:hypothetical protein
VVALFALAVGLAFVLAQFKPPSSGIGTSGIDYSRYASFTCAELLAAPAAQQTSWAEFDQNVALDRAKTDVAKANIKSFSVQEWAGGLTDACRDEPGSALAFPPT